MRLFLFLMNYAQNIRSLNRKQELERIRTERALFKYFTIFPKFLRKHTTTESDS
jgi:hypothetical protein